MGTLLIIVAQILLAYAALSCGIAALVFLFRKAERSAARSLIAVIVALALLLASFVCTLFFPEKSQGVSGPQSQGGGDKGGSATTTTTTTTTKAPAVTPEEAAQAKTALESLLSRYGNTLSVYYVDLETGETFMHNADRAYQAASVVKAPYVKYLLASGVDGSKKLTLSSKQGGSGIIDQQPVGTQFTVDELMEYAIRYSDNSAYYMLNKEFGFAGFNQYAKELGITANANSNCVLSYPRPRFGYLSARDIGLYMEDIAKFIATGSEDAKRLKTWMTSTDETRQLVAAYEDKYTVAHKYGETKNIEYAFHDGAIVYADRPYVLSVASAMEPFTTESLDAFHKIAGYIDTMHHAK